MAGRGARTYAGPMAELVRGRLLRDGTTWTIEGTDGRRLRRVIIEERNPTAHVDRLRFWIIADMKQGQLKATVDRRRAAERDADLALGRKVHYPRERRSVRTFQ